MTISRRLRFEILRRDRHTCRYCGAQAPDVVLTIDHVTPTALGGTDDPTNLVTACQSCNAGKSSIQPDAPVVADVAADALRWSLAMREAAAWRATDRAVMDDEIAKFDAAWSDWFVKSTHAVIPRDDNWRTSVERFIENGLDIGELTRLIRIAMEANTRADDTWRYFCGCAWRAITELHETARLILDSEKEHGGA